MGNTIFSKVFFLPDLLGHSVDLSPSVSAETPANNPDVFLPSGEAKAPSLPQAPFQMPGVFAAQAGAPEEVSANLSQFLDSITDEVLFGDNTAAKDKFDAERMGKYKKVNIALYAVRAAFEAVRSEDKVLEEPQFGKKFGKKFDSAQSKLEAWFNDVDLLYDKEVAHVARLALRRALKQAPVGNEPFNEKVKLLLETVEKLYDPEAPEEKKPVKKPVETKKPKVDGEPKPPVEPSKPVEVAPELQKPKEPEPDRIAVAVFQYPTATNGKRKDTIADAVNKSKKIFTDYYAGLVKDYKQASLKGMLTFLINGKTGTVVEVRFENVELTNMNQKELLLDIEGLAQALNAAISLQKQKGSAPFLKGTWAFNFTPPSSVAEADSKPKSDPTAPD